jgi:radical SAM superfamily enzyme YgiQ (UPF0313 family)
MNSPKNILLVTSAAPSFSPSSTNEKRAPLGIGFLISVLRNAGHNVFFIDNYLSPSGFIEEGYLQENNIDYVGIYSNTICFRDTLRMFHGIDYLRHTSQWSGKIIVGGPHPSVCPETIPDFVDYVVQGEGEQAILDIVEEKVSQRIVRYPRIKDLNDLPMPAWDYFADLPYSWGSRWFPETPVFTMNTSRGCPFRCTFCSVGSIWGRRYTYFSAERIVDEIELLMKDYGARGIYFREDNFTFNKKRLIEFCELLLKRNIQLLWGCETRVNTMTRESVELMSRAGAKGFYFGVESGSQKILDHLQKDITVQQTKDAFKWCHEFGVNTYASMIYGVPGETEEDLAMSKVLLEEIKPTSVGNGVYIGIPYSKMYQYVEENKLYEFKDDRGLLYLPHRNEQVDKYYNGEATMKTPITLGNGKLANPIVSVLMVAQNSVGLKESIDSILAQSFNNFELIVINNGCSDEVSETLDGCDDPRIISLVQPEQLGVAESLNKGLSNARGDLIAFMRCGDVSIPHRLFTQRSFLRDNPDFAAISSSCYMIDGDGVVEDVLEVESGCGCSAMIRKEIISDVGGIDVGSPEPEHDLWLRVARKHKTTSFDRPLYSMRESSVMAFETVGQHDSLASALK